MASSNSPSWKINPLPRCLYPDSISYNASDLKRQDESPDAHWYDTPRFVQHIDDGAIAALKKYYGSIIQPKYGVLDVCSSWVSHLPDTLTPKTMVGCGMNAAEMSKNQHLTKYFVKDLNETPKFDDIEDGEMDTVICNVSVDYLVKPVEVFHEMHRVLKEGGTAHMAFSNRCFPTKVIGRWMGMNDEERRRWVGGYFWKSGGWTDVEEVILNQGGRFFGGDPLYVVRGTKARVTKDEAGKEKI